MKNVFLKILVLMLCLVLALSSLVGCGEIEDKIEDLQNQVNQNNKDDDADAAALEELKTLVAQIQATANDAATKVALQEVIDDLAGVKATAKDDAAAAAAKLAEVEESLKALVTANGNADAAAKKELDDAIKAVKAIADAAAVKADVEAALKTLNETVAADKAQVAADLAAAVKTLNEVIAANGAEDKKVADALEALTGVVAGNATKAELNAAVETLNAAIATKADKTALETAVATLEAAIAANGTADKAALETAVATLEAAIAANTKAIADAKADLQGKIDALAAAGATDAEVAAVKAELEGSIAALKVAVASDIATAVADLKTSLEAKIAELDKKVDDAVAALNAKVAALEKKDTELAGLIAGLQTQIDQIKAAIDEAHNEQNNFANNFVDATLVLNGAAKVIVDAEGKVVKVVTADDAEWDTAVEYSLAAFAKIVVDAKYFTQTAFDSFIAYKADTEFFLGRAISAQAIVDYFAQLNAYIDEMPDLNETLAELLAAKTKVTVADDELKEIEDVIALIVANGAEMTAENDTAYKAVKAAYDNLVAAVKAADDVEVAINAIGYVVFSDTSKALIETAEAAVKALKDAYFITEAYNAYYNDNETTVVENYEVLTTARARYEQLVAANANKITVIEVALKYNTVRPLWTDKAALDANLAEFTAWCTEYEITEIADAETILAIYPVVDGVNPVDSLKLATLYADAMNSIYTTTEFAEDIVGVEALNAKVVELMAAHEGVVYYSDYKLAMGYKANYDALDAAIKFVKLYDSAVEDNNYAKMVEAVEADFAKYLDRQDVLHNANIALDAYYDANVALKGKVTFNDWTAIDMFGKNIAVIIEDAGVIVERDADGNVIGDANYIEFGNDKKDPFALQEALVEEYLALTAKVREIYDTVKALLDDSNAIALTFGNNITEFLNEISGIMALGVTDIDLPLPGKDEADSANLQTLMTDLETVIDAFVIKADAAQAAAVDVAAEIAKLTSFKTGNLNDYAKVVAVKAVLDAWVTEYLAADVADANGDVAAAVKAVAKVQVYLGAAETYYVFVSEADYAAGVKAMNEAKATYDAAEAEWAVVSAELERLAALNWNIHNKAEFEAADAAYVAYVDKFYEGTITNAVFGELDVYANEDGKFVYEMNECYAMATAAVGDANVIKNAINALASAITAGNYATELDKINEINTLIDAYKKYCGDICNDCIPEALRITLAEKEATAKLYEYAETVKVHTNDKTDAEVDKSVALYSGLILAADNNERSFAEVIATINSTLASAKSAIDKKAPCAVGGDHADVTTDADHICDYCDAPDITECAVANGTAHECDCGATSDCVVALGTAHECPVCDAKSDCAVENGTACECPICGATEACVDDDGDGACDVCGQPMVP